MSIIACCRNQLCPNDDQRPIYAGGVVTCVIGVRGMNFIVNIPAMYSIHNFIDFVYISTVSLTLKCGSFYVYCYNSVAIGRPKLSFEYPVQLYVYNTALIHLYLTLNIYRHVDGL